MPVPRSPFTGHIMKFFISLILVFVSFVIYIRRTEMTEIFFPSRNIKSTPADIGLEYEDIYFQTKDKFKINGWLVKGGSEGTVIFFHGNSGNIGSSNVKIRMFHELGVSVFLVDYRGFGRSEGAPTEMGLYRDAQAAYDYLVSRPDINMNHVIIYGESLGGAVAIDLASRNRSCGVIINGAFTNVLDMAKIRYPFIPAFLPGDQFDSLSKVASIKEPKIFIHSQDDEVVPFQLGKKLYDAAVQPKEIFPVGGRHNTNDQSAVQTIRQTFEYFLEKYKDLCPSPSL